MFIGDWMERGERYFDDALAVVDVDKGDRGRFSYREMNRRANRLAAYLRDEVGVKCGDRVGALAMNGVETLDALFACGKIGAIFVPFNWRSHARELVELFHKTEPRVLLYSDDFRETVAALAPECPSVTRYLHLEGEGIPGSLPYEATVSRMSDAPVTNEAVHEEDILCLLFTGGTTGLPKAARISYRMIGWNTLNTVVHELQRGEITITHTPMFHTGGLFVHTLPVLTVGGTVIVMRRWTAGGMLSLIEDEGVTALFCVPTQFQGMMQSPRFKDTSFKSLRFFLSGGAPLPIPVIHTYREQHGVVFKQGFGMTEFGPGMFSMRPEFAEKKAGSIGKPNYFVDARIVDENNRPLPAGEIGELCVKGPSRCSGYFGTEETGVDAEGWFHTGDMARYDEDGFFFIADRKKDMFISGGENVYPIEIEKALYEHPAVAQCAVLGIHDEKWGEVGRAVVVLKFGAIAAEEELIEHCRGRLARYKVPRSVVFVTELPLSAAGKILKRELRERFKGGPGAG